MKWRLGKAQIRWGLAAFCTAAAVLVFYYLLFHGTNITKGIGNLLSSMTSVICGAVIAYVLAPVLHFVEKRLIGPFYRKRGIDLHDPEHRGIRARVRHISVAATFAIFLVVLFMLLAVVIPQLAASIQSIVVSLPGYINNAIRMSNTYLSDHPEVAHTVNDYLRQASRWIQDFTNNTLIPQATSILHRLSVSLMGFFTGIFNFVIGIIVAVYLLNSKERFKSQAKKLVYALFREEAANEIIGAMRFTNYTFSGFLVGKLCDSLIVGIICYIGAVLLKTPYPVLMAVDVGLTNMIPFFGPYIGEISTTLLLLLIDPVAALAFFVFVFILQQFDGNILGPKILGNSTGLSSFWVIFSVLLCGNLFGLIGWVIGVPLFAVFYALVRRLVDSSVSARKLPTETMAYENLAYVDHGGPVFKREADWDRYHVRHPQSVWKRIFNMREQVSSKLGEVVHHAPQDLAEERPGEPEEGAGTKI